MQRVSRGGALALIALAWLLATSGVPPVAHVARPLPMQPAAATPLDLNALRIDARIASLSLDAKIGQLMMVHCAGIDPAAVAACAAASGASGVILMGDNIGETPDAVRALTSALPTDREFPLLVAIDEEGGTVTRLPWDANPGGAALAAQPTAATSTAFAERAALMQRVGITVNFGIVADVTADPGSFLADRVLGAAPEAAAERVAAAVGAEHGVVASTLKHFPGHGMASGNSHTVIPVATATLDDWRAGPALPFAAGIAAGAQLVMMSHIAVPAVDAAPATFSTVWHQLLRGELGFRGVIVSDDMLMLQHNGQAEYADPSRNAIRALAAGTDLLLWVLPADPAAAGIDLPTMRANIAAAVAAGELSEAEIDASLERIYWLRLQLPDLR